MTSEIRFSVARIGAVLIASAGLLAQSGSRPAVPREPIGAIIDAFKTHALVALGEGSHGNEQGHRFRLSLIRDPRFAATVNDIVVESGTARYQDVMDRFVGGESVPEDTLQRAWHDTTQPTAIWDLPIYEEFFRAVREVNASLPRERRLRVLLGDPAVDWDNIGSLADLNKSAGTRDLHAADVIRREVLAKNRRALLIYGDDHFVKKSRGLAGDERPTNIVGDLERTGPRVYVIHTETRLDLKAVQPDVATWPKPSFAALQGTQLGAAIYEPNPRLKDRATEELFDAVLYLGPPSEITMAQMAPGRCRDSRYVEMRLRRLALLPGPPRSAPPGTLGPLDRFKQDCDLR
jgi:hypothetical protein